MQFTVTKDINRISLPIKAIGQINSLNKGTDTSTYTFDSTLLSDCYNLQQKETTID